MLEPVFDCESCPENDKGDKPLLECSPKSPFAKQSEIPNHVLPEVGQLQKRQVESYGEQVAKKARGRWRRDYRVEKKRSEGGVA